MADPETQSPSLSGGKSRPWTRKAALFMLALPLVPILLWVLAFALLFLSDRFSPRILANEVDLGVLALHRFSVDSSKDGSSCLVAPLIEITGPDSLLMHEAIRDRRKVEGPMGEWLTLQYARLAPVLEAGYFDKRKLMPMDSGYSMGADSMSVSHAYFRVLQRYFQVLFLHADREFREGRHAECAKAMVGTLRLATAVGRSNLGLVPDILALQYSRRMTDLVDVDSVPIPDSAARRMYSETLTAWLPEPEWLLNGIRQEYYGSGAVIARTSSDIHASWRNTASRSGVSLPDIYKRKIYDSAETHAIHDHIWARVLNEAIRSDSIPTRNHPELAKLESWKGMFWSVIFRNTVGRILVRTVPRSYRNYVRTARGNRAKAESVAAALLGKDG